MQNGVADLNLVRNSISNMNRNCDVEFLNHEGKNDHSVSAVS
jgi:hypothetical protein